MPQGIYERKKKGVHGRKPSPLGLPVSYRQLTIYFDDKNIDLKQRLDKLIVDYRRRTGNHLTVNRFIIWILADLMGEANDNQIIEAMKEVFGTAQVSDYVHYKKLITRRRSKLEQLKNAEQNESAGISGDIPPDNPARD